MWWFRGGAAGAPHPAAARPPSGAATRIPDSVEPLPRVRLHEGDEVIAAAAAGIGDNHPMLTKRCGAETADIT